jgi:hypothetical protein
MDIRGRNPLSRSGFDPRFDRRPGSQVQSPTRRVTPTTSTSPIQQRPSTPTRPLGPVAQTQQPGGLLNRVDQSLRTVAGEIGGRIGEKQGRDRMGNLPILGDVGGRIGRNRGTAQGQQMYDRAKQTLGGLLKQDYEYDNFDIILEHLIQKGYANSEESAIAIMANMSEDWRKNILELNQVDLDRESSTINRNTRNAPVQRQQPAFQQSGPQGPSGVPIPGTARAFKAVKTVGQAAIGGMLK